MRTLLLILLATTSLFAQEGYKVTILKGSAVYHQAYVNCDASELQILVHDNARTTPSPQGKDFIKKYPILSSMKEFKKRKKYSLINANLLQHDPVLTDDNNLLFEFKNGKQYKVRLTDRIKSVYR